MFPKFELLKKIDFNFHNLVKIFLLSAQKNLAIYPKKITRIFTFQKKISSKLILWTGRKLFPPPQMFFGLCPKVVINFIFSKKHMSSSKMILWASKIHFSLSRRKLFASRSKKSRSMSENN